METITREEARENGLKRYFTGEPCKNRHIAERYVSSGECVVCSVDYHRRYREKNPEGIREYNRRWYHENIDKSLARFRRWRTKNPEKVRQKNINWQKNNPEKVREKSRRWYKNNPERGRAKGHQRRAWKNASEETHTGEDIKWLREKQNYKCVYCKKSIRKKYHVDHIYPLSKGGSNGKENLQILCPTCNNRKQAKDPIVFAQENGLLL